MKSKVNSVISFVLAFVFIFSAVPFIDLSGNSDKTDESSFGINATAADDDDLRFIFTAKGYYISSCDEDATGELIIPSTHKNKPVISIHKSAFKNCEKLTSVTIPDSVSSIEKSAFYGCKSLMTVNIPEGITVIEESTFGACGCLTSVSLPSTLTKIGKEAFCGCYRMQSLTLPKNLTEIGEGAFSGCTSLKSMVFPNTLKSIEINAFFSCKKLESAVIPKSVTSIGNAAFTNCEALTIYGNSGSCAETYAKAHSIKFSKIFDSSIVPKLTKISNTSKGVKLQWSKVPDAENYIVYRKSGSSGYKSLKTLPASSLSITDTTVKSGTNTLIR